MQGKITAISYNGELVENVDLHFARTYNGPMDLRIQLLERIGQGSFGTVYRATSDNPVYKNFALKIATGKPSRLAQELHVMSRVCTKGRLHVCRLEFAALNEDETMLVLGLELCLPLTLHDFLVSYKLTAEQDMLYLMHQVLQAVAGVHDEDCVHRDIKLQNFVFDLDCNLKLIDFGLAFQSLTPPPGDLVAGTVSFMAPEMAANALSKVNRTSVGAPADVWSVGIVLFSIVTQRNPYPVKVSDEQQDGDGNQALLRRVSQGDWQWPQGISVSNEIKELIESMLMVVPQRRPTLRSVLQHRLWVVRRCPPVALQSYLGLEGFESLLAPSPEQHGHLLRNVQRKSLVVNTSRANSVAATSQHEGPDTTNSSTAAAAATDKSLSSLQEVDGPRAAAVATSTASACDTSELDSSAMQRIEPNDAANGNKARKLEREFSEVVELEVKKQLQQDKRSKSRSMAVDSSTGRMATTGGVAPSVALAASRPRSRSRTQDPFGRTTNDDEASAAASLRREPSLVVITTQDNETASVMEQIRSASRHAAGAVVEAEDVISTTEHPLPTGRLGGSRISEQRNASLKRIRSRSGSVFRDEEKPPTAILSSSAGGDDMNSSSSNGAAVSAPSLKKETKRGAATVRSTRIVTIETPSAVEKRRGESVELAPRGNGTTSTPAAVPTTPSLAYAHASPLAAEERRHRAATAKLLLAQLEQVHSYFRLRVEEDQERYTLLWLADCQAKQADHPHHFSLKSELGKGNYQEGIICDMCDGEFVPTAKGGKMSYYHCSCGMDICTGCIVVYQKKCTCNRCKKIFKNSQDARGHECAAAKRPRQSGEIDVKEPPASKRKTEPVVSSPAAASKKSPPLKKVSPVAEKASAPKKQAAPDVKPKSPAAALSKGAAVAAAAAAKALAEASSKKPPSKKSPTTPPPPPRSLASPSKAPTSSSVKKIEEIPASTHAALAAGKWKPDFRKVRGSGSITSAPPPTTEEVSMLLSNTWIKYFHLYYPQQEAPVAKGGRKKQTTAVAAEEDTATTATAFVYHIQSGRIGAIFLNGTSAAHSVIISPQERCLLQVRGIDPSAAALDDMGVCSIIEGKATIPAEYAIVDAAATADTMLLKQGRVPGTASVYQPSASSARSLREPFIYVRWFRYDEQRKIAAFLLSTGGVQVFFGTDYELRWLDQSRKFIVRCNGVCEAINTTSHPEILQIVESLMQESLEDAM